MVTKTSFGGNWLEVMTTINKDDQIKSKIQKAPLNILPNCLTLADVNSDNYIRLVAIDTNILNGDHVKSIEDWPISQLRVYRGLQVETNLQLNIDGGPPIAIESLYTTDSDDERPETAAVLLAVAVNDAILFYRHLKPYFKYTLPVLEILRNELEIWQKLNTSQSEDEQLTLIDDLKNIQYSHLSKKSLNLLQINNNQQRCSFVRERSNEPLIRCSSIVALKSLKKVSSGQDRQPAHLVIATDQGEILILEIQGFSLLFRALVCPGFVPSLLDVHGIFETDFSIVLATRYGSVYLLRKTATGVGTEVINQSCNSVCPLNQGMTISVNSNNIGIVTNYKENSITNAGIAGRGDNNTIASSCNGISGMEIFRLSEPIVGLILLPIDQTIVVCSMNKRLLCYSKKGKQLYSITLRSQPLCMILLNLHYLGMTLIAISLIDGSIQFYMQKYLVDEMHLNRINENEAINAMIFGRMGFEEHVLCLITTSGKLILKILKRTAIFEPNSKLLYAHQRYNTIEELSRIHISETNILQKSKKSSIFVEQVTREKQNAKATYVNFQVELWHLRHLAAKVTLDTLKASERTISDDITQTPIKLSAEVCGNGPLFRLYLSIQNLSTYRMASNLMVLVHADRRHYNFNKSVIKLPSILPNAPLRIDFEVQSILNEIDKLPPHTLNPDNLYVRVIVSKLYQSKPLMVAIITMPQSEADL